MTSLREKEVEKCRIKVEIVNANSTNKHGTQKDNVIIIFIYCFLGYYMLLWSSRARLCPENNFHLYIPVFKSHFELHDL